MRGVRVIGFGLVLAWCSAATFSNQEPAELDATARARIEQARASVVTVTVVDQANKTNSQSLGFFVRKDLIATDNEILDGNSRVQVSTGTQSRTIKVLSSGHYVLPYVLVETQAEVSPVNIADSERVAVNDSVYVLKASGKITAGKVTGATTIKNDPAFLINVPIDSNDRGAPVFNRSGEVIGIAAKSPDGQSAGLMWPSQLLATLKHWGEPGMGIGAGTGPRFSDRSTEPAPGPSPVASVDTKPVRLSSPRPQYTEAARANNIQGSVTLRVLVAEDGNVKATRVIRGLPDGLTEQAIAVARQTKFKPAMKDGKPVPYWVALEVSFSIR